MTPAFNRRMAADLFGACERIDAGRLRLRTPEGHVHSFGADGPEAEIRVNDWAALAAIRARGDVGFGEAYVAGLWDSPSVEALAGLILANEAALGRYAEPSPWQGLHLRAVDLLLRRNSIRGARRNVRAHYDVGNEFYTEWLDASMTYSSALHLAGDDDLYRGQMRKHDRILDRLGRRERVLELGCGWGGFAERAADRGHRVTAVTISPNQAAYADARLDGRADVLLRDYRETAGRHDGIVSIEMIEAVGERHWPDYFATLKARLAEGGRGILQAITVPDAGFQRYRRRSDYIRHATFPGGMLPSRGKIAEGASRAGLRAENVFAFGDDYARTCRSWAVRLAARSGRLASLGYGPPTLRHWQYYLETCAASFAAGRIDVIQVEVAHA